MEMFENLDKSKQERIINAALSEFAQRGYDDASTNVITQQAGISKGALFHYFGNKAKLYDYLIEYTLNQVQIKLLDQLPQTTDLVELFFYYSQRKVELAKIHPLMFDFIYRVFQEKPDHPRYLDLLQQSQHMLENMVYGRIETDNFRDGIDLRQAIEICTWMSEGFARKYTKLHPKLEPEKLLEAADELFRTMRTMLYKEEE